MISAMEDSHRVFGFDTGYEGCAHMQALHRGLQGKLERVAVKYTYQSICQSVCYSMYPQVMLGASDVLFGMYQQAVLGASGVLSGM